MTWRERVQQALGRYMSEPAAEATAALLGAFHATERVANGDASEEARRAVVQMLVDLTFGLATSTWFQTHRGVVMPVFGTAVLAWLDAMDYAARGQEGKAILARSVISEVATAALLADKGAGEARRLTGQMRDALMAIRE